MANIFLGQKATQSSQPLQVSSEKFTLNLGIGLFPFFYLSSQVGRMYRPRGIRLFSSDRSVGLTISMG